MQFPNDLILIVSLTTLLTSLLSLTTTSVPDQSVVQFLHSSRCLANSEFAALFFTFLLCSVKRSVKHRDVWPTYLKPHAKGISYTTPTLHGTDFSLCAF
uniref:Putative secreted protein n=1 Tax=Ixodes ricinus TaxID=34613 RepID=A0A6B0UEA3_IXORI